ncbi:MAG: ATPase [Clostridiales Family XIII bacterium]|jgi:pilus assembly protein CpaF|nr:ATPase [Clostridiales Family XIII bacterium]
MMMDFESVCRLVESLLSPGAEGAGATPSGAAMDTGTGGIPGLTAQKRAIIGYPEDVGAYLRHIGGILDAQGMRGGFQAPPWYESEEDAIFHEIWGRAGMAEWWRGPYADSPSAKIIGDEIYFLADGKMKLMPQRIGANRREQLVRAFLLMSPEERLDRDFHEIYLLDGCRVTVFKGAMAKKGRDVIIFRRYIVPEYTLKEQAARGTIPRSAIPLLTAMAHTGYNVVFCGSVRSAKTTFLSTWQRLEDPALEGVMVETDPEIPLHRLMPGAPVAELIADGERLKAISKNLLRSDADYFIIAEARDGIALDTAVRVARKGQGRMKMTFHARNPLSFPEDAAVEIVRSAGGDVRETAVRVADSFDYLFHFVSVRQRNAKKLRGIYEIGKVADGGADGFTDAERARGCYVREICRYDFVRDDWVFTNSISGGKRALGLESDAAAFTVFERELTRLAAEGRQT